MTQCPGSFDIEVQPGLLHETLWVWFGPLSRQAVRVWTIVLAGGVALGSVLTGAGVSMALADAGWVVATLVSPGLAFLLGSASVRVALRMFRGRPEVFRITRNQLRLGRFAIPLDALLTVEAWERPRWLQSMGLRVESEVGELWLEVNPFAHSRSDLEWLAAYLRSGPPADERQAVSHGLETLQRNASASSAEESMPRGEVSLGARRR